MCQIRRGNVSCRVCDVGKQSDQSIWSKLHLIICKRSKGIIRHRSRCTYGACRPCDPCGPCDTVRTCRTCRPRGSRWANCTCRTCRAGWACSSGSAGGPCSSIHSGRPHFSRWADCSSRSGWTRWTCRTRGTHSAVRTCRTCGPGRPGRTRRPLRSGGSGHSRCSRWTCRALYPCFTW